MSSDSWKCIVEMNERMKFYFFVQKYTILTFIYTFLPINLYINIRINILMYLLAKKDPFPCSLRLKAKTSF